MLFRSRESAKLNRVSPFESISNFNIDFNADLKEIPFAIIKFPRCNGKRFKDEEILRF